MKIKSIIVSALILQFLAVSSLYAQPEKGRGVDEFGYIEKGGHGTTITDSVSESGLSDIS